MLKNRKSKYDLIYCNDKCPWILGIVVTLLVLAITIFSYEAFAFGISDEYVTDNEIVWHDIEYKPKTTVVLDVEPIDLADGKQLILEQDGFYYYYKLSDGTWFSEFTFYDKEKAIEGMKNLVLYYNYMYEQFVN